MFIVIVGEKGTRAAEFEQALADFGLDWDVQWVTDAGAVMALPADRAPDAVVAERELDGESGPQLLAQVRARYPQAVRILLLDEGDGAGVE